MVVVAFAERRGLPEAAIPYFADVSNPLLSLKLLSSHAGMLDSIYSLLDLKRWNLSSYIFSITANLLGTGLIAYRIWYAPTYSYCTRPQFRNQDHALLDKIPTADS